MNFLSGTQTMPYFALKCFYSVNIGTRAPVYQIIFLRRVSGRKPSSQALMFLQLSRSYPQVCSCQITSVITKYLWIDLSPTADSEPGIEPNALLARVKRSDHVATVARIKLIASHCLSS